MSAEENQSAFYYQKYKQCPSTSGEGSKPGAKFSKHREGVVGERWEQQHRSRRPLGALGGASSKGRVLGGDLERLWNKDDLRGTRGASAL